MGIFGGILRGLEGMPPNLYPGEVVQWASVPTPGIFGETFPQRPYAVKLDAGGQEVGDRRWLERQLFSDLSYAEAWCAWVNARGALPQPPFPTGAV